MFSGVTLLSIHLNFLIKVSLSGESLSLLISCGLGIIVCSKVLSSSNSGGGGGGGGEGVRFLGSSAFIGIMTFLFIFFRFFGVFGVTRGVNWYPLSLLL